MTDFRTVAQQAAAAVQPGQPGYNRTPRAYWASRQGNRHPGPYRIAVVVCPPGDALRLLHPDHVPGQTIVAPQQLAAYYPAPWALAWQEPLGEVRDMEVGALPLHVGRYTVEGWRLAFHDDDD